MPSIDLRIKKDFPLSLCPKSAFLHNRSIPKKKKTGKGTEFGINGKKQNIKVFEEKVFGVRKNDRHSNEVNKMLKK